LPRLDDQCVPARCPHAEIVDGRKIRCEDCFVDRVEVALQASVAGRVLGRAIEIHNALSLGITIRPGDLTLLDLQALQILREERGRYDDEQNAARAANIRN
jgi:hypothetical protein